MAIPNKSHIPFLNTIQSFYEALGIGSPQGHEFSIMKIEDQPSTKRSEMPLFRCDFYRVVLIRNQGVHWSLPDGKLDSDRNSIYFSYPGKLESWKSDGNIHGILICFTKDFLNTSSDLSLDFPFFNFDALPLFQLSEQEVQLLDVQHTELIEELNSEAFESERLLKVLLERYLISLKRIYLEHSEKRPEEEKNEHRLFKKFREELDSYFVELAEEISDEQATVSLIAQRLFVNANYLNSVIKNLTGSPASSFIQQKVILEAKSYLINTDKQITEIALLLGFNDSSYFNRYFKKQVGISPSSFRKGFN